MSNSSFFNAHITKTVLSCSCCIGWILRMFSKRYKCTMLTLHRAVVRPLVVRLIEYACQLWNPDSLNLITKLEKVDHSRNIFSTYMYMNLLM